MWCSFRGFESELVLGMRGRRGGRKIDSGGSGRVCSVILFFLFSVDLDAEDGFFINVERASELMFICIYQPI